MDDMQEDAFLDHKLTKPHRLPPTCMPCQGGYFLNYIPSTESPHFQKDMVSDTW